MGISPPEHLFDGSTFFHESFSFSTKEKCKLSCEIDADLGKVLGPVRKKEKKKKRIDAGAFNLVPMDIEAKS